MNIDSIDTVIGLDLSLHSCGWFRCEKTGFALGEIDCGTWAVPQSGDSYERLKWITDQCFDIAAFNRADRSLVVIETPFQGLKGSAAFALAGLGTLVRYELWRSHATILDVSPSTVKQFATGKGNSEKSIVLRECFKRWGLDNVNDDAADAYVLGRIGLGYLGLDENLTAFQRDIIAGLKNPKPKRKKKAA